MLSFFLCFILLYSTFKYCDSVLDGEIHELFGNISSLQDLFIKNKTSSTASDVNDTDDFDFDFEIEDVFRFNRSSSNHSFDIHEYDMINEDYRNFSREYKNSTRRFSHYDPHDEYYGLFLEDYKKDLLLKILIQFVMHTRYEVGKALTQRDLIRGDKRYKLGYLFNRLRRLKTEQMKMLAMGYSQNETEFRNLMPLMRFYERIVHFDVDMRDTCKMIKEIFAVQAPYDKRVQGPKVKKRKDRGPDF